MYAYIYIYIYIRFITVELLDMHPKHPPHSDPFSTQKDDARGTRMFTRLLQLCYQILPETRQERSFTNDKRWDIYLYRHIYGNYMYYIYIYIHTVEYCWDMNIHIYNYIYIYTYIVLLGYEHRIK